MRLLGRFRLVDGLAVAAAGLLSLKVLAFLATPSEPERGPDGLPRFGRVLAHARSGYTPTDPETTGSMPDKEAKPPPPPPTAPPPTASPPPEPVSPSERAIRERLAERREELLQRTREIEAREKLLEEAERRADARAAEARTSEERATATAGAGTDREAAALKGLVTMYETMKPKDAARVFDRLPQEVLVPVVRLIAPRKMAEIMAAMSPDVAQKLTVALARPSRTADVAEPGVPGLPPGELPAIEPPPRGRAP